MHKILVIRLYFPFDALRVSDCISPSSGATYKLYIAFGICRCMLIRVAIATEQPHVWHRYIPAYIKCDVQLIKLLLKMD